MTSSTSRRSSSSRRVDALDAALGSSGASVHVRWSAAVDGDHGVDVESSVLAARRRAVIGERACTWLRQVHGAEVCVVDGVGGEVSGTRADAAVTTIPDEVLSIVTADCAPIALWSDDGVVAAVHAGWRGLADGVVAAAVRVVRDRAAAGATVHAALGPCIGPECYEFGEGDLGVLVERIGPAVRGVTAAGTPALDLPRAVEVHLGSLGVALDRSAWACTACTDEWFSWRARRDRGRQAMYVWSTRA